MCMRHAIKHNLLMAIPRLFHYFGHPKPFNMSMVPKLNPGYQYNILCHHIRFNYKNIMELLPKDSILFTMLREPAALFQSSYSYYHLEEEFGMSLEQFLSGDPSKLEFHNRRFGGRIGRNQMAFDLGVEEDKFDNETAIKQIAEELNKQFPLILIHERINESLVLLKNLLCWTTDDVVIFHTNARKDFVKKSSSPDITSKVLKWNKADKILYDYFLKKFDEKVKMFGLENMKKEKEDIEARIQMWYDNCIVQTPFNQESKVKLLKLVNTTNIMAMCEYLTKDEREFDVQILKRQKQYRYIPIHNNENSSMMLRDSLKNE